MIDEDGLHTKHASMASDAFSHLRATYYRWVELFEKHCGALAIRGPRLLGVGDLHVQNFGTWRDGEGRLVWGIDDFDEADDGLPMASDLTRLAVSAVLSGDVDLSKKAICSAILDGYEDGLAEKSGPFVLENDHTWLRELALAALKSPERFWHKWLKEKTTESPPSDIAIGAVEALAAAYPEGASPKSFRKPNPENPKGLGSLGRKRFFAYNAQWRGGPIAREAKAAVSPATRLWKSTKIVTFVELIQSRAIRSPDPVYRRCGQWVCKAIMANTGRIEMGELAEEANQERLLRAMGQEIANVHRGTLGNAGPLQKTLTKLQSGIFRDATETLAVATAKDAKAWKDHWETSSKFTDRR